MTLRRFPLTRAQRAIWFGHRLDQTGSLYNTGLYTEVAGALDLALLQKAVTHVVASTDVLRLRFHSADGDLWQEVVKAPRDTVQLADTTSSSDPTAAGIDLVHRALRDPFNLETEPPFRWLFVRTGEGRWLWGQIYHHVALDGQSGWVVSNRVAETYSALCEGRPPPAYPTDSLSVLTKEEADYRNSPRFAEDRNYWQATLEGCDRMRSWSHRRQDNAAMKATLRQTCHLPAPLSAKVRELARGSGLRPEHLLMAAVAVQEAAVQGHPDVVLGTQLLGRLATAAKAYPAMASNECPIRLDVSPAMSFEEVAKQISRRIRLALRHQSYRYEDLRGDLGLLPDAPDLFGFSVNIMPVEGDLQFTGLASSSHYLSFGPVRDLSLTIFDNRALAELRLDLDGNDALHSQADLQTYLARIVFVVEQLASLSVPVARLALSPDLGRRQDVAAAKAAAACRPVLEVIAASAAVNGGRFAIIEDGGSITYQGLDQRSNRLARHLVSHGVGPETVVGIGLPRSIDAVIAVLAVLKAGGACLPLDSNYPVSRLGFMLEDSGARLLLTNDKSADLFPPHISRILIGDRAAEDEIARLDPGPLRDRDRISPLKSSNIAFLLYTSGSTGTPKGVALTHSNLANKLPDQARLWDVGPTSRFAFTSSMSFDPSLHQMLLPLTTGGTLVVLSAASMEDPAVFLNKLAGARCTHLDIVPSFAAVIADQGMLEPPDLRVLILGGEILPVPLLDKLRARLPHCRFFNMYGPTETCIDATAFEAGAGTDEAVVPIGHALQNYGVHLLNTCLRPVPDGAVGEIYISGAGVARGYWRRPQQTAERFVACPFGAAGERMYRTGDRGYRDAEGRIVFTGRDDEQVKLRGFRIEFAEIEAALLAQPGVEQAAIVLDESGTAPRIIGYVTGSPDSRLDGTALRDALAGALPPFMVPSFISVLEAMPRLANGKLDRKSLPRTGPAEKRHVAKPRAGIEAHLCALFADLTGAAEVSPLDNFFALGGHSLLMMQLISRLRASHGRDLPIDLVFGHPTPRSLADAISQLARGPSTYRPIVRLRDGGPLSTLICVHPAAGLAQIYRKMAPGIDSRIALYGIQARGIDDELEPHDSIAEMASAYVDAVREVQPSGPYHLLGWSFGGVVAHAMASLLEARGQKVRWLFLADSYFSTQGIDVGDSERAMSAMLDAGKAHDTGSPWLERIRRAIRQSERLLDRHVAPKIRAPVLFFRASDNQSRDLQSALAAITCGQIEIKEANAPHYGLFEDPNAERIGAVVSRYLTGSDHAR